MEALDFKRNHCGDINRRHLDFAGCPQCGVHFAQKSDLSAHQMSCAHQLRIKFLLVRVAFPHVLQCARCALLGMAVQIGQRARMVPLILPDHLGSRWRSWRTGRWLFAKDRKAALVISTLETLVVLVAFKLQFGEIPGGGRTNVTVAPTITDNRGKRSSAE